jgi:ABC-type multidrug transport system fused ATPase/permease subunit
MGGGFALVQLLVRRRLTRLGETRRRSVRTRFRIVQEALGGAKDVKVLGLEEQFLTRFQEPARAIARTTIRFDLISKTPPMAMQALLFGGMLLVVIYLMTSYGDFDSVLPLVALYAFAGYRLLPAIQNVSTNMSALRYREPAVNSLKKELDEAPPPPTKNEREASLRERVSLDRAILLENVSYSYPSAARPAVRNLTLRIEANTTVALVGPTGSGKSTTADIILGLLRPQNGALRIDERVIDRTLESAWRRIVGYVPQQIFLVDGTVAQNIAFGMPTESIDQEAVERAARIANLHDFIVNEMPDGYATAIGERGVRLSGGQRQRIGIARALYRDPAVLIMDEATSALDNLTEHAVMEAVHHLSRRKTIILIAHRLSTVRDCDCIHMLENGELTGSGTYDELVEQHERFRAMAGAR